MTPPEPKDTLTADELRNVADTYAELTLAATVRMLDRARQATPRNHRLIATLDRMLGEHADATAALLAHAATLQRKQRKPVAAWDITRPASS